MGLEGPFCPVRSLSWPMQKQNMNSQPYEANEKASLQPIAHATLAVTTEKLRGSWSCQPQADKMGRKAAA